jgi:hypothetical protein
MALGHAPTFAFDNILTFIDTLNPRCFDGTSATMIDLFNQKSAIGTSLTSISTTQGISFGTNKNRIVAGTGLSSFVQISESEYTKICWFNLDDVATRQPLICGQNPRHYFWMNNTSNLTSSHSGTRFASSPDPSLSSTAGTTSLSPGVWYFGATTFRSWLSPSAAIGNTGGKVYLNGKLDGINRTMGFGANKAAGLADTYNLGSSLDPTISSPVLNGKISYALVYARALSDQEILQIYNATKKRYGY